MNCGATSADLPLVGLDQPDTAQVNKLNLTIATFFVLLGFQLRATHLVGGEMYYENTAPDQYKITLKVYRDCGPSNTLGTGFDNSAPISVYKADGTYVNTYNFPFPGASQVPVIITNPCLQSPPSICIEEAIYTGNITLPPNQDGYFVVYQRCCRNPAIQNLQNPQTWGATYYTHIPGPNQTPGANNNSSAHFVNYPPLVLCTNEQFYFDHSANDPDGDSLVYSLCTPFHGASQNNPAPGIASAPPFQTVPWASGYSATNAIPGSPAISIDPQTGELTGMPTQQGLFTMGICVAEYRNGVLINESIRDFLFTVTQCTSNIVAEIPGQISAGSAAAFCSGTTVTMQNSSVNASSYFWDFGDPNSTADTSSLFQPTYTYQDSGIFTIMLVANPGWPCADTAYADYELFPAINVFFPEELGQCVDGNSFGLQAEGNISGGAAVSWDFGPFATPQNSTVADPTVSFSDTGYYLVTVTATENGCTGTYTDTLVVFPPPTINFTLPDLTGCAPYVAYFQDSSVAWTNIAYLWDFGDGETSTLQSPYHVYQNPGEYDVVLQISTDSGCVGSAVSNPATITVNPSPVAGFFADPLEVSIFTPEINITDNAWGDTAFVFYTGDGFTTTESSFSHSYMDTGHYAISQWVINEYGCTDSAVTIIWIQPEFLFFAPNAFTPDGDGLNEVFKPHVGGVDVYELLIFDRWGNVIFETTDPTQGWDGIPAGGSRLAPVGVYVYQATLRDMVTKMISVKRGHVSIIR